MHQRRRHRFLRLEAITLIDIMVVVAVIGIVAGGTVLSFLSKFGEAKCKQAKTNAIGIQTAAQLCDLDKREYPSADEIFSGRYIQPQNRRQDPWGNRFQIAWNMNLHVSSQGDGVDPKTAISTKAGWK